jgi:hypothetical protein
VFGYDEEGRLVKIERDYGSGGAQVAYEYGYNSDGARVWKRDVLNEQEYRYVCRIGCGGVPMRVYNRPMNGGSWTSVEDYLDTDSALGYGYNWQYRHSGGELLMMTASGEPSAYYPMDSNGLAVQNAPAQPCVCPVAPVSVSVCLPLLGFATCEISGYEVCLVYSVCPQDKKEKEPVFRIKKPCDPDTLKGCWEKCSGKGIPVGCAILEVKVGAIQREVPTCLCLKECTLEQLEKCREECKSQGKPLYGCIDPNPVSDDRWIGPVLGIIGVPKCACEPTFPF